MGGGTWPAAPGAAGGGDGGSGPARPRRDLRSKALGPPQGSRGGGRTRGGSPQPSLPRSPAARPRAKANSAAPPSADPNPAAGKTGTAGSRRAGSVRAEPAALPALGQAHPHMGPRDDGAGGADPSRNAAGLAPRCRARSEEQRLAVLKGGERAALPAPPAQRAWSKVTRHAQRHNKGRSPSHPPAAFLARCPGIPQRCSAPPGSGSYTYPVPAAASRGIPVSPHCPPVSPCPPHSSPCPGAPLNPRP